MTDSAVEILQKRLLTMHDEAKQIESALSDAEAEVKRLRHVGVEVQKAISELRIALVRLQTPEAGK